MKWYAHYCELGCNAVYGNDRRYYGDYYAFSSKQARDAWVDDHEWDCYPNWTARKATRAEVVSQLGKYFVISDYEGDDFDGAKLCEKDEEHLLYR